MMNSCELIAFISMISCAIGKNFSQEEIEIFAAIFTQLGDSLALIAVNNAVNESSQKRLCQ